MSPTVAEVVATRDPRKVSRKCQVWLDNFGEQICQKPTAFWYPSWGGGTMALCTEHAARHQKSAADIGLTPFAAPSSPERTDG